MSTKGVGHSVSCDGVRVLGQGRHALVALVVIGGVACSGDEAVIQAPMPGSISVTTETSGFLKDDSYELFVDGESRGTIGANDEMTIAALDPATYEVSLGDVADNCTVESASASVVSEETADVSLAVACAYVQPDAYTLRFQRDRPNLDTGDIADCLFGLCPTGAEWDLYVYYNFYSSEPGPRSVIRQNQSIGVQIAHLPGVVFEDLTEEDLQGATFTSDLVADPFDSGRVILIRTDLGNVYALGNPVEDTGAQTLSFDAALIAVP